MDTRKIINIFNEFDISSTKDESKYKISKLESITNLNHKVCLLYTSDAADDA